MPDALLASAVSAGLEVMDAMMNAEAAALAGGDRRRHDSDRIALRHGMKRGSVRSG